MYQFVDRPLAQLDDGARFLIFAMRAWVSALPARRCSAQALAPAFARHGMIGGLQPFHRAMLLLNRDGLRPLAFCALGCGQVAEDEAVLLAIVDSLARSRAVIARGTIEQLVAEDSVGDLLEAFARLGAVLAVAGLLPVSTIPEELRPDAKSADNQTGTEAPGPRRPGQSSGATSTE